MAPSRDKEVENLGVFPSWMTECIDLDEIWHVSIDHWSTQCVKFGPGR